MCNYDPKVSISLQELAEMSGPLTKAQGNVVPAFKYYPSNVQP